MANKPQLDVLIGIYREAQARLAEIITGNYGAGTRTYYNSVLKQLERLMKQLEAETGQYISTEIPRQYKKALDDTYAYFKRNNLQMHFFGGAFFMHKTAKPQGGKEKCRGNF